MARGDRNRARQAVFAAGEQFLKGKGIDATSAESNFFGPYGGWSCALDPILNPSEVRCASQVMTTFRKTTSQQKVRLRHPLRYYRGTRRCQREAVICLHNRWYCAKHIKEQEYPWDPYAESLEQRPTRRNGGLGLFWDREHHTDPALSDTFRTPDEKLLTQAEAQAFLGLSYEGLWEALCYDHLTYAAGGGASRRPYLFRLRELEAYKRRKVLDAARRLGAEISP